MDTFLGNRPATQTIRTATKNKIVTQTIRIVTRTIRLVTKTTKIDQLTCFLIIPEFHKGYFMSKNNNFDALLKELFSLLVKNGILGDILKENIDPTSSIKVDSNVQIATELKLDFMIQNHKASIHIEIQATNDSAMHYRMLQYFLSIIKKFSVIPHQYVIYVGKNRINMPSSFKIDGIIDFSYTIIDLSTLQAKLFLNCSDVKVKLLSILCSDGLEQENLINLLNSLNSITDENYQGELIKMLTTLSSLRKNAIIKINEIIEVKNMPVHINAQDTDLYQMGKAEGKTEGISLGKAEGELKGMLKGEKLPIDQIADLLDIDESLIQSIIDAQNK